MLLSVYLHFTNGWVYSIEAEKHRVMERVRYGLHPDLFIAVVSIMPL